MKWLILLICLKSVFAVETVNIEEDYKWVDDIKFSSKEEGVSKNKDEINFKVQNDDNVLSSESMNVNILESEQVNKIEDGLSKIVFSCYKNDFETAFKAMDEVYSSFKNNASYWNQVGTCYYLKNDFSKATLFYNKARDLDSKFVAPINNLGVLYLKTNKPQKALAAFEKASEMSTFSITPNLNLAKVYLKYGMNVKSLRILQGLYKKNSQDQFVGALYANSLVINKEFDSAAKIFSKLNANVKNKIENSLNYSLALKMIGKKAEANDLFSSIAPPSSGIQLDYYNKLASIIKE